MYRRWSKQSITKLKLAYIMASPNMSFNRERGTKKNVYIYLYIRFRVPHKTLESRNLTD